MPERASARWAIRSARSRARRPGLSLGRFKGHRARAVRFTGTQSKQQMTALIGRTNQVDGSQTGGDSGTNVDAKEIDFGDLVASRSTKCKPRKRICTRLSISDHNARFGPAASLNPAADKIELKRSNPSLMCPPISNCSAAQRLKPRLREPEVPFDKSRKTWAA